MCVATLVRPGVTRRNLGWDRVGNTSHNKDQVARSPQSSNALLLSEAPSTDTSTSAHFHR